MIKTSHRKKREERERLYFQEIGYTKGKIPVDYQPKERIKGAELMLKDVLKSLKKAKGLIDVDLSFIPTPNGTRILTGTLIFEVKPGSDHRD